MCFVFGFFYRCIDSLFLFAGTHLWSSSCSHMLSWDLPCLKPWDCSVWWLLSLSCLLCKTALIQHFNYRCDYIFYCGYQNCSVLVSWKCTFSSLSDTVKIRNMYCTNVRNYVIKIHVFDYLILAVTLCLDYHANTTEGSRLSWMSSLLQLLKLAINQPCFLRTSHASFWGQP